MYLLSSSILCLNYCTVYFYITVYEFKHSTRWAARSNNFIVEIDSCNDI